MEALSKEAKRILAPRSKNFKKIEQGNSCHLFCMASFYLFVHLFSHLFIYQQFCKVKAVAANLFLLVSSWVDVEAEQSSFPRQAVLMLHLVVAVGVWLQGVAVVLWVGEHVNLEGLADEVAVAVNKGIKG